MGKCGGQVVTIFHSYFLRVCTAGAPVSCGDAQPANSAAPPARPAFFMKSRRFTRSTIASDLIEGFA